MQLAITNLTQLQQQERDIQLPKNISLPWENDHCAIAIRWADRDIARILFNGNVPL